MTETKFSKKEKREISDFIGQELLYDYLFDQLDVERRQAVEKKLSQSPELKAELEKIKLASSYVQKFQETQILSQLEDDIREPSTYFWVLFQKMRIQDWPRSVQILLEGLLIGGLAIALIVTIPWGKILDLKTKLESTSVTLTEISRVNHTDPDREVVGPEATTNKQTIIYDDENKQNSSPKLEPTPKLAAIEAPKKPAESQPKTETKEISAEPTTKRQGFLFRGKLIATNSLMISSKVSEYLNQNGGRKAGEVELGWKKGDGYYFHFTIPEAKQKEAQEYLKSLGSFSIQKEPHPRIMPDGIIRLIITVEEKK